MPFGCRTFWGGSPWRWRWWGLAKKCVSGVGVTCHMPMIKLRNSCNNVLIAGVFNLIGGKILPPGSNVSPRRAAGFEKSRLSYATF
jgi:hypothetical protein